MSRRRPPGKGGRYTPPKKRIPTRTVPCAEHTGHVEQWCERHQRWERRS